MAFHPKFTITAHLLTTIEEISAFREKILAATVLVPWIPTLQKDARIRNTHGSTAIEGNPLTLEQVRLLEEGQSLPTEPPRATREVLNYLTGLCSIEKHVAKKPITHKDVLKLHTVIAKGVMDQGEAGRYRDIQVHVGRSTPPSPELVSGLMAELLEWWNEQSSKWSPVVSSAIVHYQFEDIHPFADGNGRTGRALALWELYRRGFDTHHIFSVDEVYWENRPRYYEALAGVRRQGGDLSGWLEYSAEALHLTLEKVWDRIQHLTARAGPKKIVLRPKQEQLLRLLRDRKSLTPQEIRNGIGVSKQGAMDVLNPLLEAGLIQRVGTKKSGRYILS
jgi:cell filamentation protein, protein adenylyltransferase